MDERDWFRPALDVGVLAVPTQPRGILMLDLMFIGTVVVLFVLSGLYVRGCERL